MEAPTTKRKVGKTRSVGVMPFQSACFMNHHAVCSLPLLFTMIMKAMVRPRAASREMRRPGFAPEAGATVEADIGPETGLGSAVFAGVVVVIYFNSPRVVFGVRPGGGPSIKTVQHLPFKLSRLVTIRKRICRLAVSGRASPIVGTIHFASGESGWRVVGVRW